MKKIKGILLGIIIGILLTVGGGYYLYTQSNANKEENSKTVKLGFEDIGELATQEMIGTVVHTEQASQTLFGVEIPFTQSHYIYSYDFDVKAGYDFSSITYTVDEENKVITVTLPEEKLLSIEVLTDSFKVYYEKESIFKRITLEDNNDALKEMQETAKEDAISNGIYDKAKDNAETLLKAFFSNQYNLEEYTIEFN